MPQEQLDAMMDSSDPRESLLALLGGLLKDQAARFAADAFAPLAAAAGAEVRVWQKHCLGLYGVIARWPPPRLCRLSAIWMRWSVSQADDEPAADEPAVDGPVPLAAELAATHREGLLMRGQLFAAAMHLLCGESGAPIDTLAMLATVVRRHPLHHVGDAH